MVLVVVVRVRKAGSSLPSLNPTLQRLTSRSGGRSPAPAIREFVMPLLKPSRAAAAAQVLLTQTARNLEFVVRCSNNMTRETFT